MLRPDPELADVAIAWSPTQVQELFEQRILPRLKPGWRLTQAQLETLTYVPAKECVGLYKLRLANPPAATVERAVVSFAHEHALLEAHRKRTTTTDERVLVLRKPCCMVELYPEDWKLPGLAQASQPELLASRLAQLGLAVQPEARSSAMLELLRYRPHQRCVLQLAIPAVGDRPLTRWVAKLYPPGQGAAEAADLLQDIAKHTAEVGLRVPRVAALLADWELMLMERLPGQNMKRYLEAEDLARAHVGCLHAAEALVGLHRFPAAGGSAVWRLSDELGRLEMRAASLECVAPELTDEIKALLKQLEPSARTMVVDQPCFVHGEYKPSQLLFEEHAPLAVLDLDDAGLGDPALDVGNFMAELHRAAVRSKRNELRELATVFLHEYQTRGSEVGLAARARLMQCLALLRMSMRSFQRNPDSYGRLGSASRSGQLLREAAACCREIRGRRARSV